VYCLTDEPLMDQVYIKRNISRSVCQMKMEAGANNLLVVPSLFGDVELSYPRLLFDDVAMPPSSFVAMTFIHRDYSLPPLYK
jgi:hypothetical protein